MRDGDISELKDALAAFKKKEARRSHFGQGRRHKARASEFKRLTESPPDGLSDFFANEEETFRRGVRTRLKAHDVLATPDTPATPLYTRLESPFLIWAFRDGGPVSILDDTHIEPLNSWARFQIGWQHQVYIGPTDEVVFYFLWRNDTGGDAVVNVESELLLKGTCGAYADAGWIPEFWWGTGNVGESTLGISAQLKLLEWWNQPPTQPLRQPSQSREVIDLFVEGGFAPAVWVSNWGAGLGDIWTLTGNYHLRYDDFFVPTDAVAVFEVSLTMHYGGRFGSCFVDFLHPVESSLLCPYVELETLAAPLLADG
jgi:hypothetical protein